MNTQPNLQSQITLTCIFFPPSSSRNKVQLTEIIPTNTECILSTLNLLALPRTPAWHTRTTNKHQQKAGKPMPSPFCPRAARDQPCPAGTCAWSCSSSLVENSVRQCGGTSIPSRILWMLLLMLSHSSGLKKCSRTRKPSSWN